MKRVAYILVILFVLPMAAASSSITILSVSEGDMRSGGVATAYLETQPGSGSVFIDSLPLTRLDTQISTRFAREYACQLSDTSCANRDFFYTLRASSSIIGGPSAGAALTVLTYAELEGLEIDPSIAMTGTVNAGGLIGPVGGVEEKAIAAREQGFSRVLVPSFEGSGVEVEGIEIIPVVDVEEAIRYFTGSEIDRGPSTISVPAEYRSQMESVAVQLCDRAQQLTRLVEADNETSRFLSRASESSASTDYYSAASFCFSASLRLQQDHFANKTQDELRTILRQLQVDIDAFDADLDAREVSTIADLEVFMVVRERLLESSELLDEEDVRNISSANLAYALERFSSAEAWSSFFGKVPSRQIDLSDEQLSMSCSQKVAEARERLNYIQLILDTPLDSAQSAISSATEDQAQDEWALCLFKATKAKAEADAVITAVYAGESLNQTVSRQRQKARFTLAQQSESNNFPIISYAYYEYSDSVEDIFSANLYSSYALELANLGIYSPPEDVDVYVDYQRVFILIGGVLIGLFAGFLSSELVYRRKR